MDLVCFEVEEIEVLGGSARFNISEHSNKVIIRAAAHQWRMGWIRIYMNHD